MKILITGAASGIGRSLAEHLARDGHRIIASDVSLDEAERVARDILDSGGQCQAMELDVTRDAHLDQLEQDCSREAVDVLINNAGMQHVAPLETFPRERWRQLVEIMLCGSAMVTRAVLPGMKQSNFGRIINIGSLHSLVASPYKTAYVAAKHGLLGFAKALALELGDAPITVNTICPAYIRTPMVEDQIADQAREHGISEQDVIEKIMLEPMPRRSFISLEEMVAAVSYLMSPGARNMTAQEIVLDGGWTAR